MTFRYHQSTVRDSLRTIISFVYSCFTFHKHFVIIINHTCFLTLLTFNYHKLRTGFLWSELYQSVAHEVKYKEITINEKNMVNIFIILGYTFPRLEFPQYGRTLLKGKICMLAHRQGPAHFCKVSWLLPTF